ncbi:dihydropteroate synthase, partial [Enterococcus faecium]|uniref:dihydropteroate synthase n=1 Tax=Enterococcus faecium TaxID=1352 RepID=UPI003F43E26A
MAPTILGIVNTAPDSFAGSPPDPLAAAHAMLQAGADALDIGGESTRPGARAVDPDEEQRRVLPLIRALAGPGATLSIDTRNAATA